MDRTQAQSTLEEDESQVDRTKIEKNAGFYPHEGKPSEEP